MKRHLPLSYCEFITFQCQWAIVNSSHSNTTEPLWIHIPIPLSHCKFTTFQYHWATVNSSHSNTTEPLWIHHIPIPLSHCEFITFQYLWATVNSSHSNTSEPLWIHRKLLKHDWLTIQSFASSCILDYQKLWNSDHHSWQDFVWEKKERKKLQGRLEFICCKSFAELLILHHVRQKPATES